MRGIGRPRRLITRILLHGVILLALAWGAVYATFRFVFEPAVADRVAAFMEWTASHMPPPSDLPALQAELARVHALGMEASVYDTEGRLAATNVTPPLALPEGAREHLERPRMVRGEHDVMIAPMRRDGRMLGYLVTARMSPVPLRDVAVLVGLLLCVIAIASWPLARSIARPLTHLRAVAKRLGEGDLGARAELRGGGEIGDLARSFDEMAARLEALRRTERELLANVSHELRTPLSRIRVVLELASEGDAERARKYLPEIAEDLAELERLVSDVLETARLDLAPESGGLPLLRREPVSALDLVTRSASRFRARHADRTLDLRCDDALASVVLDVDPSLLSRALDNLIDNARKYSEPREAIEIEVRERAGHVEIDILDRGVGIAAADVPRLFEPFFRGDRSRTRETGGMGLGLALAKRIVTAHGGQIALTPREGRGTCARIALPVLALP